MIKLVEDHRQARARVRRLKELDNEFKAGNRSVAKEVQDIVLWLAEFYPVHIKKEDSQFFVRTERYFSGEELARMLERFWEFDRQMIHEKYRAFYEEISKA